MNKYNASVLLGRQLTHMHVIFMKHYKPVLKGLKGAAPNPSLSLSQLCSKHQQQRHTVLHNSSYACGVNDTIVQDQ